MISSAWPRMLLLLLRVSLIAWALTSQKPTVDLWMMEKIRRANMLSDAGAGNITSAHEACQLWDDILHPCSEHVNPPLSPKIRALSFLLQASCLVRIGRDDDAVVAFEHAETVERFLDDPSREKIRIGKASSLQRLMKYPEAFEVFASTDSTEGTIGAVCCALRMGNASLAINILESRRNTTDSRIHILLEILKWMESKPLTNLSVEPGNHLPDLILYKWITSLESKQGPTPPKNSSIVDLAMINVGPFDDPMLFQLDDKIMLHRLLNGKRFWPSGFVLPDDISHLENLLSNSDETFWIKKTRAGYGSHGNEIIRTSHISVQNEPILLQKLIETTYVLPPANQRFSMRVYVIYFLPPAKDDTIPNVYICTEGLVKLAAKSASLDFPSPLDKAIYMTNSGRELNMRQETFSYLEKVMSQRGDSYNALWHEIVIAIGDVMESFAKDAFSKATMSMQEFRASLSRAGFPKILGFDFLVDSDCQPWLLEVNRFPGMEPREDTDEAVKKKVLEDAWILAAQRFPAGCIQQLKTAFAYQKVIDKSA